MTDYEHKLLEENNIMLRQIIAYINNKESTEDFKSFIINVLANNISNNR